MTASVEPRTGAVKAPVRRSSRHRRRQTLVAWGFALPFLVVFAAFMVVPLISSLAMSLTDFTARDMRNPLGVNFIGLQQYLELFQDPRFLNSLKVTGIFVLLGIPITVGFALVLALTLHKGISRFKGFYRVLFYAPVVTSIVAVSVVWRYMLQNDGLVNTALAFIGVDGPNWLNSTTWALPSLIAMAVWRNTGTLMVIFLAGLQAIPQEVEEAASLDGAGTLRRHFSITLPMLRPTLLLGAVLISVGYLQFFEEAFVMTQGGPLDSTLSAAFYIYDKFGFGQYGASSAAGYVLFIVIAAMSLLQFRLLRSKDEG